MSHSFAGVRGLKYYYHKWYNQLGRVALLRGGAWIEINAPSGGTNQFALVALLRGGAWIEIPIKLTS